MVLSQLRIAFMGTPEFASNILKALLQEQVPFVAVYTQPPRPVGRGYKVLPSPVEKVATEHHIPVFSPSSLKAVEVQEHWRNLDLDLAIVAAYGLILPPSILEAPRLGCLNVHGSLLPRWRGAAPVQRAILEGDQETGITLMKMDEGMDTGDILLMKEIPLDQKATTPSLLHQLSHLGAKALLEALPLYVSGKLPSIPQPKEGVTYADKLKKEEGRLDWYHPAATLERKVRALNPWPGTWMNIGEDRIKVLEAEVISGHFQKPPGTILDEQLTIVCGEEAFRPLQVQKVGKSPLSTQAFLRGYTLPGKQLTHDEI